MDDAQIAFAAVTAITRSASSTWKTIESPKTPPVPCEYWFEHEKTFGVWRVLVKDHRAVEVEQQPDDEEEEENDVENTDDDEVVLSRDDRAFVDGLERARIVLFLEEDQGTACYDSETTGLLREALMSALTDGSVDIDDVRGFMDRVDEVAASLKRKGVDDFEMKVIAAGLV